MEKPPCWIPCAGGWGSDGGKAKTSRYLSIDVFNILVLFVFSIRQKGIPYYRPVLWSFIGFEFLLYPFYRIPLDLTFAKQWTLSIEGTSTILDGLLTNVYRAFDIRDENRVYDRLAMSVTGDKLAQIYLQNRRSLELENRDGVRTNADEVNMLSVKNVKRAEYDGFIAE